MMLYHEPQVGKLCGVHTLNTLLQGPFFSEVDLAHIAGELDALERRFMAEGGVTSEEYLKFMAEESGNAAMDGDFSIQVLSKALEVWGLAATNLQHPSMAAEASSPQLQNAFICNLEAHWFTLRRVGAEWWNFNSVNPAPQPLGTVYLDAFLGTLRSQGYTIFVVKGELPRQSQETLEATPSGKWFTPEEAREVNRKAAEVHANSRVSGDDSELAAALAASLSSAYQSSQGGPSTSLGAVPPGGGGGGQGDSDADLANAIAASLAGVQAPSTMSVRNADPASAAPKPSQPVPEEPSAGAGVLQVGVRLPDGNRLQRRFRLEETVGTITDFLLSSGVDMSKYQLATTFPRRVLSDLTWSMTDAKLTNQETIVVELRRAQQ